MRNLKLSALLTAVGVLTIAGVGNSAPPKQGIVRLQDFIQQSQTLLGYPGPNPPPGFYKRVAETLHLRGVGGPLLPPNPCNAFIKVYNIIIDKVPEGPGRQAATQAIIRQMAQKQCCADIVRDGTVDETVEPAAMVSFRPVVCGQ